MVTKKLLVFSILTLFLVGLVSAGMFDWITGKATSQNTAANVQIGNTAPIIYFVEDKGTIAPTEEGTTSINFHFYANDSDGNTNLNDSTAKLQVNLTGEETRYNYSCVKVNDIGSYGANYSCIINMWYFDQNGDWTVNATIKDVNDALATNTSQIFSYDELTAFIMTPTSLNWTGLSISDIDVPADNHPIVMNNTGNDETDVNVTGINLPGVVDDTKIIYAENFTANNLSASDGTGLSNATTVQIINAYLDRGNNSLNLNNSASGQEQLYFYLEAMNSDLIAQNYSTSQSQPWEVSI